MLMFCAERSPEGEFNDCSPGVTVCSSSGRRGGLSSSHRQDRDATRDEVPNVRQDFQIELGEIRQALAAMADAVRTAMRTATEALLTADHAAAETVVARDAEIDALYRVVEDKVFTVVARQAPVASDLRLVLTGLHIAVDLERMGDMAEHVGRATLRRTPDPVVSDPFAQIIRDMGEVADRMAAKIPAAIDNSEMLSIVRLERDDDAMDELHRRLFASVVSANGEIGVEAAIDVALLGQFYERFGDHVVNIGRQIAYLVTGEKVSKPA